MAVIVKDINMPSNCDDCEFCVKDWGFIKVFCSASTFIQWNHLEDTPCDKRHSDCPLVEIPKGARLIDVKELKKNILKWLPPDPCGVEEKEFPFETDICVSTLMEIEEAPVIFEEEEND